MVAANENTKNGRMPANRSKRLIYVLLVGLLCVGAAASICVVRWQSAHANDADKTTQAQEQRKLAWLKESLSQGAPPAHMSDHHPCLYVSFEPKTTREIKTAGELKTTGEIKTAGESKTAAPQLGECGMATSLFSDPVDRFEVDLRYGSFVLRQTDLFLNDSFSAPFTRAYTSQDWFEPNQVHAFGKNANHTYDIAPLGTRNPYTWIAIALEDGDFLFFDRISKGSSYSDALYRHTETSGRFYQAITYWNDNGWTTKLADGSLISFPESYQAKKIADGAPLEIQDARGNKLHLVRDTDRKLQEIRTPHGQVIRLTYNDQGWIRRAEDDWGHWVAYLYNSDGMLVTVIPSSGKRRDYEYDDTLLTVVRDDRDNILVRNTYDQGRIVAQQFADGQVYEYSYQWSPNGRYIEAAIVRFPDGTLQEIETGPSIPDYVKRPRQ
jgi:YD repeat-containing protein